MQSQAQSNSPWGPLWPLRWPLTKCAAPSPSDVPLVLVRRTRVCVRLCINSTLGLGKQSHSPWQLPAATPSSAKTLQGPDGVTWEGQVWSLGPFLPGKLELRPHKCPTYHLPTTPTPAASFRRKSTAARCFSHVGLSQSMHNNWHFWKGHAHLQRFNTLINKLKTLIAKQLWVPSFPEYSQNNVVEWHWMRHSQWNLPLEINALGALRKMWCWP